MMENEYIKARLEAVENHMKLITEDIRKLDLGLTIQLFLQAKNVEQFCGVQKMFMQSNPDLQNSEHIGSLHSAVSQIEVTLDEIKRMIQKKIKPGDDLPPGLTPDDLL